MNDGSTDGTANMLDAIKVMHHAVRVINHDTNRGGSAARNTAQLIEEAQHKADHGVAVSEEVGQTLAQIVEHVQSMTGPIEEVAAASVEQAKGIDQLNIAVSQMDQVTQANAANSEQAAAASEELLAQAVDLNDMVNILTAMVGGTGAVPAQPLTGLNVSHAALLESRSAPRSLSAPQRRGLPAPGDPTHF
ncbi:MAG: glycosyltransferase [Candidatus Competibacteraceae bacterium]|nr:glycosyltransferase [Candidatus Competibacteraceae bacterium]